MKKLDLSNMVIDVVISNYWNKKALNIKLSIYNIIIILL